MDRQAAEQIAADVVAALAAKDFDGATARFDKAMRAGLAPSRLAGVWATFESEHGALTTQGQVLATKHGSLWTTVTRLAFERAAADLRISIDETGAIAGLYIVPAQTPDEQIRAISSLRSRMILAAPLFLAVIVGYAVLADAFDLKVGVGHALVGAGGWALALSLRAPVAVFARRSGQGPVAAQTLVVASSGPLEEGVRVGALAVTGSSLGAAYSLGLGWAGIEAIYAMVNAGVAFALARRDDERGQVVRSQLAAQNATGAATPVWGVVERISASAFHIGATLLLAAHPAFVVVTVPMHSGLNLVAVRLAKRGVWVSELVVGAVGASTFLAGLVAKGAL